MGSREQLAVAQFAEALLVIPRTLTVNAAHDATELVARLRAHHYTSQVITGRLPAAYRLSPTPNIFRSRQPTQFFSSSSLTHFAYSSIKLFLYLYLSNSFHTPSPHPIPSPGSSTALYLFVLSFAALFCYCNFIILFVIFSHFLFVNVILYSWKFDSRLWRARPTLNFRGWTSPKGPYGIIWRQEWWSRPSPRSRACALLPRLPSQCCA